MSSPKLRSTLVVLGVFLGALLAIEWQFSSFKPGVLFGDDLSNFLAYQHGEFASNLGQCLFGEYFQKYRPVFAAFMWLLFAGFKAHLEFYLAVATILQAISAVLVFSIALRLSRGNWIVATALALAAATSRFALYQATQLTGLLEGLAVTLFLLCLYFVVRLGESDRWEWSLAVSALALEFLTVHTHERYIVLALWMPCAFLLFPQVRALPRRTFAALMTAAVAPLPFNVLYKKIVLEVPFFVGTGGSTIGVDGEMIVQNATDAVLSLWGFNSGESYLAGAPVFSIDWFPAMLVAACFALSWGFAVVTAVKDAGLEPMQPFSWQTFRWPLLLLAAAGLLLGAPLLSIRLEQRWLFASYVLILLVVAWAAGVARGARVRVWVPSVVLCLSALGMDAIIRPYFENIFFVSSGRFADGVWRDVIRDDSGAPADIALVAGKAHCEWSLLNGRFFSLYGGRQRGVHCFDTADEALRTPLPAGTPVYTVLDGSQ